MSEVMVLSLLLNHVSLLSLLVTCVNSIHIFTWYVMYNFVDFRNTMYATYAKQLFGKQKIISLKWIRNV